MKRALFAAVAVSLWLGCRNDTTVNPVPHDAGAADAAGSTAGDAGADADAADGEPADAAADQ